MFDISKFRHHRLILSSVFFQKLKGSESISIFWRSRAFVGSPSFRGGRLCLLFLRLARFCDLNRRSCLTLCVLCLLKKKRLQLFTNKHLFPLHFGPQATSTRPQSMSYSCNDNQNYFVGDGRTTSKVLRPPGGRSVEKKNPLIFHFF